MSFNNPFDDDLERVATNHSHKYKDYPEFETLSTSIENQLHHINSKQLGEIKRLLSDFENDPINQKGSENLSQLFQNITESYKKLNEFVKQLNSSIKAVENDHEDVEIINYLKQKENIQIKLIKDSLANFKNYQRRFESKQASQLPPLSSAEGEAINTDQDQSQSQQHQQQIQIEYEPINAEELEQQTLLIQEREREIHQIQQDTQEINNIFSNLSSIINEQQFKVDNIENNIFSYDSNVRQASNELNRAQRYQKRSNGRLFCCLMILIGVSAFIILIQLIF